jgi:hypothetical protein
MGLSSLTVEVDELTSLTVSGNLLDLTVDTAAKLASLTISATMDDLSVTGSDKLTSLDVSSASIHDIDIDDNDALSSLTLDATLNQDYSGSATAETTLSLQITSNDDLTSLTVESAGVTDLDVTANTTLETIDFSGLTTIGAAADILVSANDLNADSVTETDASENEGSINDGTSGMDTLSDLLTAAAAQTAAVAYVRFDSAETITNEATGELDNGADISWTNGNGNDAYLVVIDKSAGSAGGDGAVTAGTQTTAFGLVGAGDVLFTLNGIDLDFGDMTGDKDANVATILASGAVDTAAAAGATVTAKRGYNSSSTLEFDIPAAGGNTLWGERYSTTAQVSNSLGDDAYYGVGESDSVTLTIGTESVTVTAGAGGYSDETLVDAIVAGWAAADNYIVDLAEGASSTQIAITAGTSGAEDSLSYDLAISVAVADSTAASSETGDALDWIIGSTRLTTDNSTVDAGIIIQFTSLSAGATNNTIVSLEDNGSSVTDTLLVDGTDSVTDTETGVDGTSGSNASTGITTNRSGWL